jgi:hypothetical protein
MPGGGCETASPFTTGVHCALTKSTGWRQRQLRAPLSFDRYDERGPVN